MSSPIPSRASMLLGALLLAGCVSEGPYPSLARRPEEANLSTLEPVRETPVVASDAAFLRRIATLRAQAQEGAGAFQAAVGATEAAVGRAGASGSESWVEAQQALSRLEAARAPTTIALAELDQLATSRTDVPTNEGDLAELNDAIVEAQRAADAQNARIEALRTRLSAP